jgi:hypothetical protein
MLFEEKVLNIDGSFKFLKKASTLTHNVSN